MCARIIIFFFKFNDRNSLFAFVLRRQIYRRVDNVRSEKCMGVCFIWIHKKISAFFLYNTVTKNKMWVRNAAATLFNSQPGNNCLLSY